MSTLMNGQLAGQVVLTDPGIRRFRREQAFARLRALDAAPYRVTDAIALAPGVVGGRYGRTRPYVCFDQSVRYTKMRAQAGLGPELIASRLAHMLTIGPEPIIVRGTSLLFAGHEHAGKLFRFGTIAIPDSIGSKELNDLGLLPGAVNLRPDSYDRGQVAAFHTWINVYDEQILIDVITGHVISVDHGDCFRELQHGPPSRIVLAPVVGARLDPAAAAAGAVAMVERIERLTFDDLLDAVACMPDEAGWLAPIDRRFSIARWLQRRQPELRREVTEWLRALA